MPRIIIMAERKARRAAGAEPFIEKSACANVLRMRLKYPIKGHKVKLNYTFMLCARLFQPRCPQE